jgi:Membrane protein involved in the export of O-antigen and teichoic acid
MRSENSIKNVTVNIASQLFSILLSFLCRTVFIRTLGESYLGVSGLFSNILSLLSLAELGVGTAIVFSMYEPLARNDRKKIGALMGLYRRAYHIIGLIVAAAGLAFAPFYKFFINNPPDIPNLTLIYFLYLFNTVLTYFFSYKQSIIIADQKSYVCTLYQYGFCIIQNILQIFILFRTKNFILYLCTQILFSFFTNFFLAKKAEKMYPYLKSYEKEKLEKSDRSAIYKNVRAMFMHRIGGAIVNGTDNILISKFFGLASVGIYSNYFLITNTLNGLTAQIFNGITASVGNLGAVENERKSYPVYLSVNFAGFWIFSFCSISLFCLLNPFIRLWTGRNLLLPMSVVFFIVLNFYATGMRQATLTFKNAFGLFWYDRYKAIVEAVVNLIASILLAQQFGISGVFIGTLISTMTIDFWVEPAVLFRHGFHRSPMPYFTRYAFYTVLAFAVGFLTWYCCSLTDGLSAAGFALKCAICLILPNLLFLLVFYRSEEFQYLKGYIRIPALFHKK